MAQLPSAGDLIGALATFLTGSAVLVGAVAKASQIIRRGRIDTFRESLQANKEELARCWEERHRLEAALETCEARNAARRDEAHKANNQLMKLMDQLQVCRMELDVERRLHGKGPWIPPDENGDPR